MTQIFIALGILLGMLVFFGEREIGSIFGRIIRLLGIAVARISKALWVICYLMIGAALIAVAVILLIDLYAAFFPHDYHTWAITLARLHILITIF